MHEYTTRHIWMGLVYETWLVFAEVYELLIYKRYNTTHSYIRHDSSIHV